MRVSIIDKKDLKEIERRRQGLRILLTKFTFGLADNMRWMPASVRELFEAELQRLNDEGKTLLANLLSSGTEKFIEDKKDALIADIKSMYRQLGRKEKLMENLVNNVKKDLQQRLERGLSVNFMPQISHSVVKFDYSNNELCSPWGQAFSLLSDIVSFPRKALTDSFFFRGVKVPENDLINSMNVADDALCRDLDARNIKARCRLELELLTRIEKADIAAKERCDLAWQILDGCAVDTVQERLINAEAAAKAEAKSETSVEVQKIKNKKTA